jgi:peptidoglycan/xylan/chitin deacetylase (PgdA/CDA1 family)
MRVVSPLLKHVVYPGLSWAGYLRRWNGHSPAAVTYHGVLPKGYQVIDSQLDGNLLSAENLRQQVQFLKTHYEVISPEDFRESCETESKLPPRAVLLTCDDGLRNHLTAMLPVLRECAVRCLFFVTGPSPEKTPTMLWHEQLYLLLLTGPETIRLDLPDASVQSEACGLPAKRELWRRLLLQLSVFDGDRRWKMLEEIRTQLGQPESWGAKYREHPVLAERFLTLSRDDLRQMADAGMSIGAHTDSHPNLSQMPDQLAAHELQRNREQLELTLGRPVWALAFPFGDPASVSAREMTLAEQCGFTCAFVNHEYEREDECRRFALPRVHVTAEMSRAELEARLSGFHSSLRQLLA